MLKQMCWLSVDGPNTDKILHLRTHPSQPWQPYTAFREHAAPDYKVPNGSKGWATYQKLLRLGWSLVASAEAEQESLLTQKLGSPKA